MPMTNEEWQVAVALPLELKILKTQQRIREWVTHYGEEGVYIQFSGGKDSCVLLHMIRELYPDIPATFIDGLEFPEIREFVKTIPNVVWLKPKMSFRQIIKKYGYPYPTKVQADYVHRYRYTARSEEAKNRLLWGAPRDDGKATNFRINEKYHKLIEAPFDVSEQCCNVMKIEVSQGYQKATDRVPFIGITYAEGGNRLRDIRDQGCNAWDKKEPQSRPLGLWDEQNILEYIVTHNVPYCKEYYGEIIQVKKSPRSKDMIWKTTGYERSGCWGCLFGVDKDRDPNRFVMMKQTHPQLWKYCFKDYDKGGLGLNTVCDYMNIPYGKEEIADDEPVVVPDCEVTDETTSES